jgi:predicted DCC family thiol-disulfide oxidoreductase YuxK
MEFIASSQELLNIVGDRVNTIIEKLTRPLNVDEDPGVIEKNINLVRILVGLGICHSYLDILGFSPLLSSGDFTKSVLILICALSFLVGFLTPVACALLIGFNAYPVVPYLGTMVLVMVLWALFFLGTGRRWSVDSLLLRSNYFRPFINSVYSFALYPSPQRLGQVRFLALFLYWGVCVQAVVFHFEDYIWINGDTLQILFLSPYWTDFYLVTETISNNYPLAYDLFCGLGLLVQTVWEMGIIPFMYFKWGRLFVMVQGLLFFVLSIVAIDLGYLPYYEICFWILIFNYSPCLYLKRAQFYFDDRCNLCKNSVKFLKFADFYNRIEVLGLSKSPPEVQELISQNDQIIARVGDRLYLGFDAYRRVCTTIFPFVLLYPVVALGQVTGWGAILYNWIAERRRRIFGVCEPYTYSAGKELPVTFGKWAGKVFMVVLLCAMFITAFVHRSKLFGQGAVNVINEDDLIAASVGIVITETHMDGTFKRVVPFMDINGGRLDYLRNDLLYFMYSLQWQRNHARNKNFTNDSPPKPTQYSHMVATLVSMLDACLEGPEQKHFYKVNFYMKDRKRNRSFEYWSAPKLIHSSPLTIGPEATRQWGPRCHGAYNLPPGHYFSDYRTALTEKALREATNKSNPVSK